MEGFKLKQEFVGTLTKEDVNSFLTSQYPQLEVGYYGWVVTITKNFAIRAQIVVKKDRINIVSDVAQSTKVIGVFTFFLGLIYVFIAYSKERGLFMNELKNLLQEKYGI